MRCFGIGLEMIDESIRGVFLMREVEEIERV